MFTWQRGWWVGPDSANQEKTRITIHVVGLRGRRSTQETYAKDDGMERRKKRREERGARTKEERLERSEESKGRPEEQRGETRGRRGGG